MLLWLLDPLVNDFQNVLAGGHCQISQIATQTFLTPKNVSKSHKTSLTELYMFIITKNRK